MRYLSIALLVAAAAVLFLPGAAAIQDLPPPAGGKVDFAADVAPIIARSCLQCHGPDTQMGGLRLDTRAGALTGGRSGPAISPGNSSASRLIRLVGGVEKLVMPMTGSRLTPAEVGILRAWIDQGAEWSVRRDEALAGRKHWAYTAPQRPALPPVKGATWVRNPVDRFVLARLENEGLEPSLEASRETLIRRVTLDLTGLLPTPGEVDAFVADRSPEAYEKVVDRLLASPHFGERWALPWLDLARYADSQGWGNDSHRAVWLYRDWVVGAFNADMPFDRFTIEQMAGDLLPDATVQQKIATGFHRNTMINDEAGVDPEEFRMAAVLDRAETTATVWLGATLGCTRCHDHKFDPFTQEDYYRFVAYFNNSAEEVDYYERESKPLARPGLRVPAGRELDPLRRRVEDELAQVEDQYRRPSPELEAGFPGWEREVHGRMASWTRLEPRAILSVSGAKLEIQPDCSVLASGVRGEQEVYVIWAETAVESLTALRLEVLTHPTLPFGGPGRGTDGTFLVSGIELEVASRDGASAWRRVELASATADFTTRQMAPRYAVDDDPTTGWGNLGDRENPPAARQLVVMPREHIALPGGARMRVRVRQESSTPHQTVGCFRLSITSSAEAEKIAALPIALQEAVAAVDRTAAQRRLLDEEYRRATPSLAGLRHRIANLRRRLSELTAPTAYVMAELPQPRVTHMMAGGNYRSAGKPVTPGVPGALHPMAESEPSNRLGLARWLVDRRNPLVARVTVNRFWQEIFGRGLVETPEDFGSRAPDSTHPDLLNWLAVEFMERGWSLKMLLRTIVTSATYRQDSRLRPDLAGRDPENRLLARGPRFRMPAEMIRDIALAASGRLDSTLGGPPVFPPQPDGVWPGFGTDDVWVGSTGPERFRRAIYTYWRRTTVYPAFAAFDAPSREVCVVRRARTNTPLQALTTLNDVAFFDLARGLARRALTEARGGDTERLTYAFRLCTGRSPTREERARLKGFLTDQRARFAREPELARRTASGGDVESAPSVGNAEFAAWILLANVLLNLDETLTKG
jgi:hypothetical protein